MKYRYALDEEVAAVLHRCSRREREQLFDRFAEIARYPDDAADFELRGRDGRMYSVALRGNWVITYWLDFPVREVRFVGLEKAS